MSGEAIVSAPGKTILFGEHAAVYGHAALVTALDHRMTVRASTPSDVPLGALRLEIPSMGITRTISRISGNEIVKGPGDLAILAVAIAAAELKPAAAGFHVRIESRIPAGAGFGSSAALAVAVIAACRRAGNADVALEEIARLAFLVEQRQHERASGVDVQAVLRGGTLWCLRPPGGQLACDALSGAGPGLDSFRLFHSGTPAETTGDMVAAVRRMLDREPSRVRDAFATIDAATLAGREALIQGDTAGLIPIVRRAEAALEAIGVVPETVRERIRAIEAQGGAAKVSGAGSARGPGAGLVLVVHTDPAWHERFTPPAGWTPHRVALGAQGLRMEVAA